ncbi:MAG: hypothetical protein K0R57_2342 [Paenibacillaceae bacterium]|jgi:hypothetical protein|nr:hypothetical protein [Paenibacillaceae bacterium]
MEINILHATMSYSKEDGYVGKVEFEVSGHKEPYEIVLHSKKRQDWSYGLFFLKQPGDEEQIEEVEDWLEDSDEAYLMLIDAAMAALPEENKGGSGGERDGASLS